MADDKHQERARRTTPATKDEPGSHHIADEPVTDAGALGATVQKPTTETGLPIEEQVRKEWDPKKQGGLPTSVQKGER